MADEKRPYRMTRRAQAEKETRLRITESAVELHGTLGPAGTTISALAEHAGVRRATVYRHFPDEAALFAACSSHWLATNPFPDLAGWAGIKDEDQRLAHALGELYGHYRRNAQMMTNILRDEVAVPVLTQTLAGYRQYLAAARDTLMAGRRLTGSPHRRVQAAIGHALAFSAWHSLAIDQGLEDVEVARLMCLLIWAAGQDGSGARAGGRRAPP